MTKVGPHIRFRSRFTWAAAAVIGIALAIYVYGFLLTGNSILIANIAESHFNLTQAKPAYYLPVGLLQQGYEVRLQTNVTALVSNTTVGPLGQPTFCAAYLVSDASYQRLNSTGNLYDCGAVSAFSCYGDCVKILLEQIVATASARDIFYVAIFGQAGSYYASGSIVDYPQRDLGNQVMQYDPQVFLPTTLALLVPELWSRKKHDTSPETKDDESAHKRIRRLVSIVPRFGNIQCFALQPTDSLSVFCDIYG